MAIFDRAVLEVNHGLPLAGFPFDIVPPSLRTTVSALRSDELLAIVIVECATFGLVLRSLDGIGERTRHVTVSTVVAALCIPSLLARATNPDAYLGVGLATLGTHAYAPPAVRFSGDLAPINAVWGVPLFASAYGPVWIAVSALVTAPLSTLAAKLVALRVLGAVSVVACAYLARRLGAARAVVAGIACNPALWFVYVAGAHNDLFGVDMILAGMLAARRNVAIAFAWALAACLVKITLAPVAIVAAASLPAARLRLTFAALLAASTSAIYVSDGGVMLQALISAARKFPPPDAPLYAVQRDLLIVLASASSVWVIARGRPRAQSAWTFPALGATPLSHYVAWGLPFALAATPVALTYLVTLPLLAFAQDYVVPDTPAFQVTISTLVPAAVIVVAYRLRPNTLK